MKVFGRGPEGARILICGEAPGASEELAGEPFVGASGQELNRMLQEAGIMRSECYMTNVSLTRPLDNDIAHFIAGMKYKRGGKSSVRTDKHVKLRDRWVTAEIAEGFASLQAEIARVKPNLVIVCGNVALWTLTGNWAITKWRGSQLISDEIFGYKVNVIPTIHPAAILQQWDLRAPVVNDLRRAARHMQYKEYQNVPAWNFILRPSFDTVQGVMNGLNERMEFGEELWIDFDIETKYGHIDCISVSWSRLDAICIPLIGRSAPEGYWSANEEAAIVFWLYKLLTHPRCHVRWQNGLYDSQYVHKWWHFLPRNGQDTMISQHSCFAAMPKGLGFLGSMYADYYVYWKDEGKIASNEPEEKRWRYNCLDCIYTREVGEVLEGVVDKMGLREVESVQQRLFPPVLSAMLRGVAVSSSRRAALAMEIQQELSAREAFLYNVLGHTINVGSSKQMQTLLYDDLKQPIQFKRTINGNRPSCDDESLEKIAAREPLIRPVCNAISDIRTLSKWLNDFVLMPLDTDGRMRCSFNIAGDAGGKSAPYSYRLSSGKNAFDSGGNLQTIPSEKSKSAGKAAQRGSMDFTLPNLRSMYVPDPGYTFFDLDLDRADLQVVVWEANDEMLKAALRMGADVHLLNTYGIDGVEPPPLEELVEGHPRYAFHRGPRKYKREFAKVFCHATNYLGGAKTVAAHTGRLVHEIDRAQKVWFGAHPGIKAWHKRTEMQVQKFRFVENRFGYKWFIFERIDNVLSDAVAWLPQSTVGAVINRIWLNFHDNLPEVQTLLQVHDSVAGQIPSHKLMDLLPRMKELAKIIVPYEEPLIIPTGIKTSPISWGECA